jgi:tRNA threonylcarbamoyladenosine biosynthesis protein TsaB
VTDPVLLAFDTATSWCSVALARGAQIIELAEPVGQQHSDRVLPMAQRLLADEGMTLTQMDAIVFGAGPGSFTGLRIACGVAQGAAYGIDRPVLAIGNLAALALDAVRREPRARRIAVAIDARMSEIYWAVYDAADDDVAEVVPPSLSSAVDLPPLLADLAIDTLAGDALMAFAGALDAVSVTHRLPLASASAGTIVRLARHAFARGEAVAPALAMPVYVRNRVALTIEERIAARAGQTA